jgi:hypothetical protein
VDYNRTGDDLSELILECEEVLNSYSYKAKRLATEVKFITQHNSQLKVIITGLSQGAAYVNEVMELLKSNQQVYGIIAGLPFYSQGNDSDRLRVISDNGISPDALTHGDLPALIKTLFTAQFRWIKDGLRGGLLGIGGYLDPPGHQYLWSLPEVRSQVMSFLQKNFGGKT